MGRGDYQVTTTTGSDGKRIKINQQQYLHIIRARQEAEKFRLNNAHLSSTWSQELPPSQVTLSSPPFLMGENPILGSPNSGGKM